MRLGKHKESTTKLAIALEKYGKTTKERLWRDLAHRILVPKRQRVAVNLWRLQALSKKFSGKTIVVPGKVLGNGVLSSALSVAAMEFSGNARKKIENAKGRALLLRGLLEKKPKASSMVIVC